jgi:hypothetical protein
MFFYLSLRPSWLTFTGILSSKHNELQKKMEKLHRCYMKGKEWKESIRVVQQSMSRVSGPWKSKVLISG